MALDLEGGGQLTIEEAAAFLNVSVPCVVALIEANEIRFSDVHGSRLAAAEVAKFKQQDDAQRRRTLDELTSEAEFYRLGYPL